MKRNSLSLSRPLSTETVAEFGTARLVRVGFGRLELHGGSVEERAEAREWASLFLDAEYVAWLPTAA